MNVLIVDDDRFVVAALSKKIDWKSMGFINIYTAHNIIDAKEILQSRRVDLLLSDIDMPLGSGLDLLSWVRSRNKTLPCILLTNYADFDYAQKAIELQSFHYYLKPIEYDKLTEIIQKATATITQSHSLRASRSKELINNLIIRQDFADISPDQFLEIGYAPDQMFFSIGFHLYPYYLKSDNTLGCRIQTEETLLPDLKKIYRSAFSQVSADDELFWKSYQMNYQYFSVVPVQETILQTSLHACCEEFIRLVKQQLHCPANIFVGSVATISEIPSYIPRIRKMREYLFPDFGQIYWLDDYKETIVSPDGIDVQALTNLLSEDDLSSVAELCRTYLDRAEKEGFISVTALTNLQIDIVQALYSYLQKKGILATKLYSGSEYHILSSNAILCVSYMEMYLQYMLTAAENTVKQVASDTDAAQIIKAYVDTHFKEDISRETLADILYFDPDYASRLFKKETGLSFKNYLIEKRIETAKQLLRTTQLPVSVVSSEVGYDNYSYFTRLFKKVTGKTPIEYRINE